MPPRAELTALHLRVLAFLVMHPRAQGSDLLAEIPGLKSGTLYPMLRQFAERGLLLAEVQEFGGKRITYSVTSKGENAFAEGALKLISDLTPALERVTAPAQAQTQASGPRKTRFNQEMDDLTAKIQAGAVLKANGHEYALESDQDEPQRVTPRAASELIRRAIVTESAPGQWVSASPPLF